MSSDNLTEMLNHIKEAMLKTEQPVVVVAPRNKLNQALQSAMHLEPGDISVRKVEDTDLPPFTLVREMADLSNQTFVVRELKPRKRKLESEWVRSCVDSYIGGDWLNSIKDQDKQIAETAMQLATYSEESNATAMFVRYLRQSLDENRYGRFLDNLGRLGDLSDAYEAMVSFIDQGETVSEFIARNLMERKAIKSLHRDAIPKEEANSLLKECDAILSTLRGEGDITIKGTINVTSPILNRHNYETEAKPIRRRMDRGLLHFPAGSKIMEALDTMPIRILKVDLPKSATAAKAAAEAAQKEKPYGENFAAAVKAMAETMLATSGYHAQLMQSNLIPVWADEPTRLEIAKYLEEYNHLLQSRGTLARIKTLKGFKGRIPDDAYTERLEELNKLDLEAIDALAKRYLGYINNVIAKAEMVERNKCQSGDSSQG